MEEELISQVMHEESHSHVVIHFVGNHGVRPNLWDSSAHSAALPALTLERVGDCTPISRKKRWKTPHEYVISLRSIYRAKQSLKRLTAYRGSDIKMLSILAPGV